MERGSKNRRVGAYLDFVDLGHRDKRSRATKEITGQISAIQAAARESATSIQKIPALSAI